MMLDGKRLTVDRLATMIGDAYDAHVQKIAEALRSPPNNHNQIVRDDKLEGMNVNVHVSPQAYDAATELNNSLEG